MTEKLTTLAELLRLARCYSKQAQFSVAIEMLKRQIAVEQSSAHPDRYTLSLCLYSLSEVYSQKGEDPIAEELQIAASRLWDSLNSQCALNLLWYLGAIDGLRKETERLISLAQAEIDEEHIA